MKGKIILLHIFFILACLDSFSQDKEVDSLKQVLAVSKEDTTKVNTLLSLSKKYLDNSNNSREAIKVAMKAKDLAEQINYKKGSAYGLKNIGMGYYLQGENVEALAYWEKSLAIFESIHEKTGMANMLSNMGAIYFIEGDDSSAMECYLKGLTISEDIHDTLRIITGCINIGAVYFNQPSTQNKALEYYLRGLFLASRIKDNDIIATASTNIGKLYLARNQYDTALFYFEKSLKTRRDSSDLPYILNDIGRLYTKKGDYDSAVKYHNQAYQICKASDSVAKAASLNAIGETYNQKMDFRKALSLFRQAELIAPPYTKELKNTYEGIVSCFTKLSDYTNASKFQKLLLNLNDSINNKERTELIAKGRSILKLNSNVNKMTSKIDLLAKDNEIQKKEMNRQKIIRNSLLTGTIVVFVFAGILFKQRNKIRKGKKLSDELLLNILPSEVAEELKQKGSTEAKQFADVTVMFTDFKDFTRISEKLSPTELVSEIHMYFKAFDGIISKHNIEKIKTIGDSYMCAGGLPVPNKTNANDVVKAAVEIQLFMKENVRKRKTEGKELFEIRIGVHTGPVVAGIVGVKKFAYDIWGDTVNIASRMESSGEAGKVNISNTTYELVNDKFKCTHRGKIHAKNKGSIDMYFVEVDS